jgi:hypothetical protein
MPFTFFLLILRVFLQEFGGKGMAIIEKKTHNTPTLNSKKSLK